ncbi:uncharacterized protein LOC113235774 [Hyposmocoma kahamanoa]|uniref:uncharacterized protein LOC113235774 n=1 Tax=Hyposmocoma kahamanoa TaxID=1477025 RepID=UPI000E6D819A|nr:uncharacterized protein LOC113235774 [Hyposmocoma kahamanoa]
MVARVNCLDNVKNSQTNNNVITIYTDPTKTNDKKFLTEIFPKLVKAFDSEKFEFFFIDEYYAATKRMCAFDQWKNDYEKQLELFVCEVSGSELIDCINNIGWTDIDAIICAASKFKNYRYTSINNYNSFNVTTTPIVTIGKRMISQIFHDNVMSFICAYFGTKHPANCISHKAVRGRLIKPWPKNVRLRATYPRNKERPKIVNIFSNFSKYEDKEFFSESFPRIASNFGREVQFDYYFMDNLNESSKRMCALDQWKSAYDKQSCYFKCEAKNVSESDCIDIVGQSDIDNVICAATMINDYTNTSLKYYSKLKTNRTPVITIGKNLLEDMNFFAAKMFICLSFDFKFNKYTCASKNDTIAKFANQAPAAGISSIFTGN